MAFCLACAFALVLVFTLAGCGGSSGGGGGKASTPATGADFDPPSSLDMPEPSAGATIDVSHASEGYITAQATNSSRLKFQVTSGDMSYNYDLPNTGEPIVVPVNMGSGSYTLRVMQNTSGSNYVEVSREDIDIQLESEFAPFLIPNVYCNYNSNSACVALARQLTENSQNQGEAVATVLTYLQENISYDQAKAKQLSGQSGYVPNPDETLASKKGICFDYASLAAAMLRSLGFPTKIITGYVGPNNIYHAWIMVYADGSWQTAEFSLSPKDWSRMDVTFAAAGQTEFTGNGTGYVDRYVY